MSNILIDFKKNSESLISSDIFLHSDRKLLEFKSDTSTYFHNIISFGFENDIYNSVNDYTTCKILQLSNNTYLSLFLKKLSYNWRIFSSEGMYIKKENLDFVSNIKKQEELDTENNDSIIEVHLINIERLSSIHLFLANLKMKDNEADDIMGMKDIFLKVDELADNRDYISIDDLISSFISFDFSFQFHISLLTATYNIKDNIKNRVGLYENALKEGIKFLSKVELESTLRDQL
jgi:hypothetical protein